MKNTIVNWYRVIRNKFSYYIRTPTRKIVIGVLLYIFSILSMFFMKSEFIQSVFMQINMGMLGSLVEWIFTFCPGVLGMFILTRLIKRPKLKKITGGICIFLLCYSAIVMLFGVIVPLVTSVAKR